MTDDKKGWLDEELYQKAIRSLPIVCVDLVVSAGLPEENERILLVRRKNEPLAGHWWFPGGRIEIGEPRVEAAIRKLKQECGVDLRSTATRSGSSPGRRLIAEWLMEASRLGDIRELETHDIVLRRVDKSWSHSVTTVVWIMLEKEPAVTLDSQSSEYRWMTAHDWLSENDPLHEWVQARLQETL
jgi:8-oxo-dGTP pyrophosphatase MutT (NUDIX family)